MKKISTTCMLLLVVGLFSSPVFAIEYCKDFLEQGNPGGWSASLKTFDDEWTLTVGSEVELDIWVNDVPLSLLSGGFWIQYDPSKVSIVSVDAYDGYDLPGPWEVAFTGKVPDAGGPGTYMLTVGPPLMPASPDGDGDIIIAKVRFRCESEGDATITISTIPEQDTFVDVSPAVLDGDITDNNVVIHQETDYCEGNFDDDDNQDGSDAALFKADFGRDTYNNPCSISNPCNGDFDCDSDCDGTDAALFKADFGRDQYNNPCPSSPTEPWCSYPEPGLRYTIDFLESGNPGGWTSSLKTFDESWQMLMSSEVEVDVWLNDCSEDLLTAGFSMEYDPSGIDILSVEAYDNLSLPGPWDAGFTTTTLVEPGTYNVMVGDWAFASADGDDDIIIAKVRLRLTAPMADITFRTVSGHDTVVDEFGTVYDSEIDYKTVTVGP